jgi:hypothetical protein
MQGANKELWKRLCEQAAVEQDPQKLLELTKQINDLLLGKQHRLDASTPPPRKAEIGLGFDVPPQSLNLSFQND